MLGDFMLKMHTGKGNLFLTCDKIWYAENSHSYMSNVCAQEFWDSNLKF